MKNQTFKFFVRNVVSPRFKGISHDLIHWVDEKGNVKETVYVAYSESQYAKKTNQLRWVQKNQEIAGTEWDRPFFAALKVFICMGHDSDMSFEVDDNMNVTIK